MLAWHPVQREIGRAIYGVRRRIYLFDEPNNGGNKMGNANQLPLDWRTAKIAITSALTIQIRRLAMRGVFRSKRERRFAFSMGRARTSPDDVNCGASLAKATSRSFASLRKGGRGDEKQILGRAKAEPTGLTWRHASTGRHMLEPKLKKLAPELGSATKGSGL
jgi:hypothetical protein